MAGTKVNLNLRWPFLALWQVAALAGFFAMAHISPQGSKIPALVWTSIGVVGISRGLLTLRRAWQGRAAVADTNGFDLVYATDLVQREIVRGLGLVSIVLVGAVSLLPTPPSWVREQVVMGLMYVAFSMTFNTLRDSTLRKRMDRAKEET